MLNLKRIVLLLIMTTLANPIFCWVATPLGGPEVDYPLEIYAIWNPNDEPLFILSTITEDIDYTQSTIQYATADYDLSLSNQTENFSFYVNSNFNSGTYDYELNIYYSDEFVPVSDTEFNAGGYPVISLDMNTTLSSQTFEPNWWTTSNYIDFDSSTTSTITYGARLVDAQKKSYTISIPSGYNALELLYFNFYWSGYTQTVTQYWDLEAYVKVELVSI